MAQFLAVFLDLQSKLFKLLDERNLNVQRLFFIVYFFYTSEFIVNKNKQNRAKKAKKAY